jgi:hypothetical protein
MFAPKNPASARDANKSASASDCESGFGFDFDAMAKTTYAPAVPRSPPTSTGLRPILSERRPHSGANTNCIAENVANRSPICAGVAP